MQVLKMYFRNNALQLVKHKSAFDSCHKRNLQIPNNEIRGKVKRGRNGALSGEIISENGRYQGGGYESHNRSLYLALISSCRSASLMSKAVLSIKLIWKSK